MNKSFRTKSRVLICPVLTMSNYLTQFWQMDGWRDEWTMSSLRKEILSNLSLYFWNLAWCTEQFATWILKWWINASNGNSGIPTQTNKKQYRFDLRQRSRAACTGLSPSPLGERSSLHFYRNSGLWKPLLWSKIQDKVSSCPIPSQTVGFSCFHLFKKKYLLGNNYVA